MQFHNTVKGGSNCPFIKIDRTAITRLGSFIYMGAEIGAEAHVAHGAVIREDVKLAEGVSVGCNTTIDPGCRIGARTRIHANCFLSRVTTGSDCFIAPGVTFADDFHPPCPKYKECTTGAILGDRVRIGAGATILPGVKIGNNVLVAAGAVVTKDVPAGTVVSGIPAKYHGQLTELTCNAGFYDMPYEWCEDLEPNKETQLVLKASERGEGRIKVSSAEEMFKDLGIEDDLVALCDACDDSGLVTVSGQECLYCGSYEKGLNHEA